MIGSWVWKSKNRDNKPLEKLYEWYCVKPVGNFRMAYAVRPQYRIDPKTHEETNDIECYITIEYQKCVDDAVKKFEDDKWFGSARYDKALFLHPQLLRVCFTLREAHKVAYARYAEVLNEVGGLLPKRKFETIAIGE